jgi:peptidoglycan/xylan/chitin deacetylase (PgdA/CDA1 family)
MILAYHEIVSDDCPYLYSVTAGAMEQHLHLLSSLAPASGRNGDPLVTFDDGHISQFDHGLPLLERFSLKGAFFITPQWTDARSAYMTWGQLKEIKDRGHQVQSHGWSHRFLTQCTKEELKTELDRSKEVLEDRLGVEVDALAVPFGAWNRQVLDMSAEAGYKRVYVSEPWLRRSEQSGMELLGRICVQRTMDSKTLLQFDQVGNFSMLRTRYRVTRAARAVLGEKLYHRVWCWLASESARDEINEYVDHSQT